MNSLPTRCLIHRETLSGLVCFHMYRTPEHMVAHTADHPAMQRKLRLLLMARHWGFTITPSQVVGRPSAGQLPMDVAQAQCAHKITARQLTISSPEGSPTRPVAPPKSATGLCPQRWNQVSTMMPIKLPKCKLSAVGSNPQYTVRVSDPANLSSLSLVVSCTEIPLGIGWYA